MVADFNQYKDSYRDQIQKAMPFRGIDVDYFTEAKAVRIVDFARRELGDLTARKILDVGCGVGTTSCYLIPSFGEVHGVDVSEGLVAKAREANPSGRYRAYDGRRLPFSDGAFDLVFAINVMHHVPPAQWPEFVTELRRVVRPGGAVMVFEHNPYNPLTRRVVRMCAFDEDAVLLRRSHTRRLVAEAGLREIESRYILFFPWRGSAFAAIERGLAGVPLGAQYYVAARK